MDLQQIQIDVVGNSFEAGGLKNFSREWRKLTSDTNILDIAHGCYIEFIDGIIPVQNKSSIRNIKVNKKEEMVIDTEVKNLLDKKVIDEVQSIDGEFISPIFVRPKKNGEYRMILNLKALNQYVEYHHFKMDTFETALNLIKPNCFLASVDIRHAYYSVPIDEQYRKFLRFMWKGKIFQYSCLPNGLASAPRLFTKLMKVVYATLRRMGHVNMGYIDDSLLIGDTFEECTKNVHDTVQLLETLGFLVHRDKSVFEPSKNIHFLGFIIDSEKMIVYLTEEKMKTISQESRKLMLKNVSSIREVARVLGLIVSSFSAVELGPLHYRDLEIEKIKALENAKGDFDANMNVTPLMKTQLNWWYKHIFTQIRNLGRENPKITIKTDASLEGWGAVLSQNETGGRWNAVERENHINYLELLAIFYGLKSFENELTIYRHVKILTDNTTAVSYVNKMGGVKSQKCNEIAKSIWFWAIDHDIWLTAAHIAGKNNCEADVQSRHFNDQVEWQLNKHIFSKLCLLWKTPHIDLFASRLNTQLKRYCSWKPDPGSEFVDAFTIDWSKFYCYLFPPFSMISQCVKKMIADKTTAMVVVPIWPSQPWFPQILQMLIDTPVLLTAADNLLTLPYKKAHHPLYKTLNLMACLVSGNTCLSEEFLKKQPVSLCAPGDQELRSSTKFLSKDGFSSVVRGKLIVFVHL